MPIVANFIAFQLGWFAIVLSAAHALPWAGSAAALAIIAWHLRCAARPGAELVLMLAAAAVGALWDSLLAALGLVEFPNGTIVAGTAPYWMVALWMLFATTLNRSLAWLKRSLPLAAALGAIGGPLAYLGGAGLGALVFVEQRAALAALAVGWAVLTPLLVALARRYDGFAHAPALTPETRHA